MKKTWFILLGIFILCGFSVAGSAQETIGNTTIETRTVVSNLEISARAQTAVPGPLLIKPLYSV